VAQLAAPEQAKIERELDHALREWSRLPTVEVEFAGWPEDLVLDFVFEWSLEEDRLRRLAAHAERGELTAHQRGRYERLVLTVKQHRPIVERLING
jgi:hypothetical protein